ncbi:MAG: hypothetical protein U5Q03_09165 [Bacteroidota bacterium]|nr:hypothetical protein [Bacteroidota bacterium]
MTVFKRITPDWLMILITAVVLIWVSSNYKWGDGHWNTILKSDGPGYYAYLPAVMVYGDLNFAFIDSLRKEMPGHHSVEYEFRRLHNGNYVNKYYAGTALMQLPFYTAGHFCSLVSGRVMNGYSAFYLIFVHISTIFYALVALLIIRAILKSYQARPSSIAFVLTAMVFGTNMFHYIVSEPAMSHIYSLVAVSAFILYVRKYFLHRRLGDLYLAAFFLGLILLIRPVNGIVLFCIPFLAGDINHLKDGFRNFIQKPVHALASILLLIAVFSIQLIIYWWQSGDPFVYAYKGEGFEFLDPDMINILFSYRKGLFIYTPLLFVSIFGFVSLFRQNRYGFYTLLGFLFILVYVLSSWEQWYYGGSFSGRVFIDFYALFALLLFKVIASLKKTWPKRIVFGLLVFLIILCQVQTYQYRTADIHWSDMTKEKYWESFPTPSRLIKKFK